MSSSKRALHFVLKVGNLRKNLEFFRDKLGMKVLRHEVFDKGCEAACNGPYDQKWSKTMIGYGPEDDHFVLELTYNYSVKSYDLGNDLQHIKINLEEKLYEKIKSIDSTQNIPKGNEGIEGQGNDFLSLLSPDRYEFLIQKLKDGKQDIIEVCLSCKDLDRSTNYWSDLLDMTQVSDESENGAVKSKEKEILLSYGADSQACLRLREIGENVDHKTAYGRLAFSCPSGDLKSIQETMEKTKHKILTPFLSLDTPGKATVQVVILADPDDHEICFVGDEGFRELSRVDEKADELMDISIKEDKSDEWFEKKRKRVKTRHDG